MMYSRDSDSKDIVYVNILINGSNANYNPTGPGLPNIALPPAGEEDVLAQYKVTKTVPFIDNPSEYYCAITRFVVPLQAIPIFIMPIVPNTYVNDANPGNPDMSTINLGFEYNNTNYTLPVRYISNTVLPQPIQNQPTQVVTPYYYVYSYSELIKMLNDTLISLWVMSGLNIAYPNLTPPRFLFSADTGLVSIIVPYIFVTTPVVILYANNSALRFLDNFPFYYYGLNQPYGKDYSFLFYDTPDNYYPVPRVPNPNQPPVSLYYIYQQDYKSLYYWSSLRRLIFTSQLLPISNEVVPTAGNTGEYSSFPIITDFVLDVNEAGSSRSIAVYNPTAQYRLVTLSGNHPITQIDIQVYWVDQYSNIYPLYIPQNQVVTMKLGFFKKELYKNSKYSI